MKIWNPKNYEYAQGNIKNFEENLFLSYVIVCGTPFNFPTIGSRLSTLIPAPLQLFESFSRYECMKWSKSSFWERFFPKDCWYTLSSDRLLCTWVLVIPNTDSGQVNLFKEQDSLLARCSILIEIIGSSELIWTRPN